MTTAHSPTGEIGPVARVEERSLNQQAYEEIRRRILDGALAPASPLSEHQLAVTLHLSRTPVREAIKRLEQEGLVRSIPNRGTFVAELAACDIIEIYQVREPLEGFAARLAAEQMPAEEVQALLQEVALMRALATESRLAEVCQADLRVHQRIIAATHNSRLITILALLDDQMHRVRAPERERAPSRR